MRAMLIKTLLGAAGQLLDTILKQLISANVFGQVLTLVQVEVQKLEGNTSLDNEAKRKAATAAVKTSLKAVGVQAGDSALNLALELAVAGIRASAK